MFSSSEMGIIYGDFVIDKLYEEYTLDGENFQLGSSSFGPRSDRLCAHFGPKTPACVKFLGHNLTEPPKIVVTSLPSTLVRFELNRILKSANRYVAENRAT